MELLAKIFPSLIEGTKTTIIVFLVTILLSIPLALLLASIQNLKIKIVNKILAIYIYIERGTPLMLQLMFVYFGLPYLGITLDRMSSVYVAFVLNYTAYFIEIIRGGIQAVDGGQFEASKALGIKNFDMFMCIILPQALRNCLPSITNEVLSLVKDTSLITILGAGELLKAGRTAVNTYASAIPFIWVGVIYLILTALATLIMHMIENKAQYN